MLKKGYRIIQMKLYYFGYDQERKGLKYFQGGSFLFKKKNNKIRQKP